MLNQRRPAWLPVILTYSSLLGGDQSFCSLAFSLFTETWNEHWLKKKCDAMLENNDFESEKETHAATTVLTAGRSSYMSSSISCTTEYVSHHMHVAVRFVIHFYVLGTELMLLSGS